MQSEVASRKNPGCGGIWHCPTTRSLLPTGTARLQLTGGKGLMAAQLIRGVLQQAVLIGRNAAMGSTRSAPDPVRATEVSMTGCRA